MASGEGSLHVAIQLDRQGGSYYPDDEVHGTITIESPEELEVRSVTAGLVFMQEYQLKAKSAQNPVIRWDKEEHWIHKDVLAVDKLSEGYKEVFPFTWRIPPDATPPCSGKLIRNRWLVQVKVDRPLARDVVSEEDLPLVVPPSGEMIGGEFSDQKGAVPAYMSFTLPKLAYVDREVLSGELTIGEHTEELEVRGVRVELVRREHVSIEDGKTRTTIEQKAQLAAATTFKPGTPETYKFQMPVSTRGCPSVVSTNGEVTWLLRGVLDRPGAKDIVVQQEVYFFNGPNRV